MGGTLLFHDAELMATHFLRHEAIRWMVSLPRFSFFPLQTRSSENHFRHKRTVQKELCHTRRHSVKCPGQGQPQGPYSPIPREPGMGFLSGHLPRPGPGTEEENEVQIRSKSECTHQSRQGWCMERMDGTERGGGSTADMKAVRKLECF